MYVSYIGKKGSPILKIYARIRSLGILWLQQSYVRQCTKILWRENSTDPESTWSFFQHYQLANQMTHNRNEILYEAMLSSQLFFEWGCNGEQLVLWKVFNWWSCYLAKSCTNRLKKLNSWRNDWSFVQDAGYLRFWFAIVVPNTIWRCLGHVSCPE